VSCRARIRASLPARRAMLCDLLEREREEVPLQEGEAALEFGRFQVVTLKLDQP